MPMLLTAENVINRFGISRDSQDEYALQSQQPHRGSAAGRGFCRRDRANRWRTRADQGQGNVATSVTRMSPSSKDEGNRPQTTLAKAWPGLNPVVDGGS